jgi:hypothetical protein
MVLNPRVGLFRPVPVLAARNKFGRRCFILNEPIFRKRRHCPIRSLVGGYANEPWALRGCCADPRARVGAIHRHSLRPSQLAASFISSAVTAFPQPRRDCRPAHDHCHGTHCRIRGAMGHTEIKFCRRNHAAARSRPRRPRSFLRSRLGICDSRL